MYVYSKSEHPKEADEFARYLLSEDMQISFTNVMTFLPLLQRKRQPDRQKLKILSTKEKPCLLYTSMSIIALPLEQGKLFLYLIIWIGIYGKVLPHVLQISKIISSIITGIGSGIGEQVKRSTMEPTLLIYSAGDWA